MNFFHVEDPHSSPAKVVHPTAIIDPSAELDAGVKIGPYSVIGPRCKIGAKTWIGAHAVLEHAIIGASCQIFPGAFVGTAPQDLKYRGEETHVELGDGSIVRECVTINRGTTYAGKTVVGRRCLLMAYAHVAHDCIIGDEVILANSVAVAGHVQLGEGSVVGGLSGIHQFVRIGKFAMIAAGSMVSLDVLPYTVACGDRARVSGLNLEGLKRRQFDKTTLDAIKKIVRQFYSAKSLKQFFEIYENKKLLTEEKYFLEFLKQSKRGVCRPKKTSESGAIDVW